MAVAAPEALETKAGKPARDQLPSKGLSHCSAVIRLGIVLRSGRALSADEAYDLGQLFYLQSSEISDDFIKTLRDAVQDTDFESTVSNPEPRYRMAPAIIIDYPEVILSKKRVPEISTRVCYTVGASEEHKIWLRVNLARDLPTAAVLETFRTNIKIWESITRDFLVPRYKKTAAPRIPGVALDTYIGVRIFAFSCEDDELKEHLETVDSEWSVFGNFLPLKKEVPRRFRDFFKRADGSTSSSRGSNANTQENYAYYRAPISRRGVFHTERKRTFCSLIRFDISKVHADIYMLSYEYAHPATHITHSSAHISSGELSFEIGRLY